MKTKLIRKFSSKENPYSIFSQGKKGQISRNPQINCLKSSKYEIKGNPANQFHSLIINNRPNTAISSISKYLKTMDLNSNLYSNYINSHSNLTQEYSFKSPKVKNYPIFKNQKYISIKCQSSLRNLKDGKSPILTDPSNSIFLSYMKEIKIGKKFIEEKPYGFKYGETKIRFDRTKTAYSYRAGKDYSELCGKNLF